MSIVIRHIKVKELKKYTNSAEYHQAEFHAISKIRALSQAANPRSTGEESALFLAYDEERLVGYLGALPDILFLNGGPKKVCWLSCMWILPDYRRKGVAKLLLENACKNYNDDVLITNYIPISKAAFLKGDQFREILVLPGLRIYLNFHLETIVLRKFPGLNYLKFLFRITDYLGNSILGLAGMLSKKEKLNAYTIQRLTHLDDEAGNFLKSKTKGSLFGRDKEDFDWWLSSPWVSNEKPLESELSKYYFSQYHPQFKKYLIAIRDREQNMLGLVLLVCHKGVLKTHYIFCDEIVIPALSQFIKGLMRENKINTLVSHHEGFCKQVRKQRWDFLYLRPSEYGFMATRKLSAMLKDDFGVIYEGDGDSMFT